MKIYVSVVFLFLTNISMANQFEKFVGEYEVVSQNCIENGEEVLTGCNIIELAIGHEKDGSLWLNVFNDLDEKHGKALEEFDYSDDALGKVYKSKITGQESNATWSLFVHIKDGTPQNRVKINETVNFYNRGEYLMYYYSYIERSAWKKNKRIFRTYKLVLLE